MIEMKDVSKTYPNGVVAANGINVKIAKGEFVYVVGPSGAGKSTFIKMMYREEKPSKGNIIVNGVNLPSIRNSKVPLFRRNIGMVFQDFKLLEKYTVYENVAFAMEVIETEPADIKPRVMEVLDLVGLKHKARMKPTELSGVTRLSGQGGYTDDARPILMCVVDQSEFTKLKQLVKLVDAKAFVIVTDASEVLGEGFKRV